MEVFTNSHFIFEQGQYLLSWYCSNFSLCAAEASPLFSCLDEDEEVLCHVQEWFADWLWGPVSVIHVLLVIRDLFCTLCQLGWSNLGSLLSTMLMQAWVQELGG